VRIFLTIAAMAAAAAGSDHSASHKRDIMIESRCVRVAGQPMTCMAAMPDGITAYDVAVHDRMRCVLARTPLASQKANATSDLSDGVFRWAPLNSQVVSTVVTTRVPMTVQRDSARIIVQYVLPDDAAQTAGCERYRIRVSQTKQTAAYYEIYASIE
jgi:hypothetical protein